jgi:hypothetical protein
MRGKGAFVGNRPVERWDRWTACGLEWCALQHAWCWGDRVGKLESDETTRDLRSLVDEAAGARARGVDPWWWAWVVPSRVDAWLARFAADVRDAGTEAPGGLILNLELAEPGGQKGNGRAAWDTSRVRGAEDAARDLIDGVRDAWDGELWVTTHGLAVSRQPWSVLRDADGVMPQAYNPGCAYKAGFVGRCVRSYAEGPMRGKPVIPLLGANSTLAGCMRRFIDETMLLDPRPDGVGWWSWAGLESSASKRAEIAAYNFG